MLVTINEQVICVVLHGAISIVRNTGKTKTFSVKQQTCVKVYDYHPMQLKNI